LHAVHKDMCSHIGAVMSLEKATAFGASTQQKLNRQSSTKAELVGVDDLTGQVLLTRCFLQTQGYDVTNNMVYQDNLLHYAKSYRPFELFVNENYKL